MRFSRLGLLAYGKFTDKSVELPAGATDFHLLYGPNEAGKSTLRSAVVDFLYGIPGQTALNFLHDYSHMRLGAVVESSNGRLELTRRKGNKNTLRGADGKPFADEALAELLGGGDRAFYERMFALSHERLREGGEEILQGKGDAAEALFSAAAGVRGLHALRGDLEKEARELWTPRKSKNVRYYQLADELANATQAKREATANSREWQQADRALTEAEAAYQAAQHEQGVLESRRNQLERIRRVAPQMHDRREAEAERSALGDVRLLPPEAAETVKDVQQRMAVANDRSQRLAPEIKKLQESLAQVQPDTAVSARSEDIELLVKERQSLSRHEGDIGKRHVEAREAERRMLAAAKGLGWGEASAKALESQSPSRLARADLRGLLESRGAIRQRAESSKTDLEQRLEELRELEAEAAELEAKPVSAGWKAALEEARALGDAAEGRARLAKLVSKARADWDRAVGALRPWKGSAEELRLPPPASVEQAREWLEKMRAVGTVQDRLRQQQRELAQTLDDKRLRLEQLVRDKAPVTRDEIDTARADRDRLWGEIVAGRATVVNARPEYEHFVDAADTLADQRFAGAEAAAEWTSLHNEIDRLQQQSSFLAQEQETARGQEAALEQSWRQAAERLGDGGFEIVDYNRWLTDRDRALEKAEALQEAETALADFDARVERLAAGLREAWAAELGEPQPSDRDDLGAWVARTESRQQELLNRSHRKTDLDERVRKLRGACERAQAETDKAEQAWAAWQEEWRRQLAAIGLPENTSPAAGSAALDTFDELDEALKQLRDKQTRIRSMQDDQERFAGNARRLAEALAPDWIERPADDIATELSRRLDQAAETEKERARLADQLQAKQDELEEVRSDLAKAQAELRPLLEAAGATDLSALQTAIVRSDRARQLDESIRKTASLVLREGAPLGLDALEAEFNAEAGTDPAAELSQIASALKLTQQRIEDAIQARNSARHALDAFGAGDAAARAEARRQETLSEMIDVSESWVGATVQTRLLDWAIRRYREQTQTPLLQLASELFRQLTLGSFKGLLVDDDGEKAVIKGCRASGDLGVDEIPVEAMSDGTRDQLYLSLRVAALELHLAKGEPLPFLADDLFVNWDNERARAGLRVLAELSRHTQVLFLTHHKHLLTLAEEASGERCSVHEIEV